MKRILPKLGKLSLDTVNLTLKKLFKFKEKELQTEYGPVYYLHHENKGKPTLVLIHGFSDVPETFLSSMAILKGKYNIILPALKGFDKDGFKIEINYSMSMYVETIKAILDFYKIDKAHIGGNSLGGGTALKLYELEPDLVESLILINSAGFEHEDIDSVTKRVQNGDNPFHVKNRKDFNKLLDNIFHKNTLPRPVLEFLYGEYIKKADDYVSISYQLFANEERLKNGQNAIELGMLKIPVCLIWGESDGFFPLDLAKKVDNELVDSELIVLYEAGHSPQFEKPYQLQKAILNWLKRFS